MTAVRFDAEDDRLRIVFRDSTGTWVNSGMSLNNHKAGTCGLEHCCLHNPSDHPLKDAPMNWRMDIGLMERMCEHGIGHDDPDDAAYRKSVGDGGHVHGCDGCCGGWRDGIVQTRV